jgi:hypothetical protein
MNEYRASKFRFVEDKIVANTIYVIFLFLLPIVNLYFLLQSRDEVLNSFNSNKEIICKVGSTKINVSKKDNWIYEDYYFVKGETNIVTTKCEEK